MITALSDAGFVDYYEQCAYDRGWIYRATRDGFIVDVIWQMANRRAKVDEVWFERACSVVIRGEKLQVVPAEELLWHKMYVLQRERCDWPDIFNLLYENGPALDWEHLVNRAGADAPLIGALLLVFDWFCPGVSNQLPAWLKERFAVGKNNSTLDWKKNIGFLDSRPWFVGLQPPGENGKCESRD